MKIAIYELVHIELVNPLARLFEGHAFQVVFFVDGSMQNNIMESLGERYGEYEWVYRDAGESHNGFFNKLKNHRSDNRYDIFLVSTVSFRHLQLYHLLKNLRPRKVIINVHGINNLFYSGFTFTPRSIARHIGKRQLITTADAFIVNTGAMKDYIIKKDITSTPVFCIPPVIFEPGGSKRSVPFNITVAGTIDERRRDYITIVGVYKKLLAAKKNVQLTLAGKPVGEYGKEILEACRKINEDGGNIHFFTSDVPEIIFRKILDESSVLLSPVNIQFKGDDGITEIYGITKNSGNINDALRHAVPVILPGDFIIPADIMTSSMCYRSVDDLFKILLQLIESPEVLKKYRAWALKNSLKFTREKMLLRWQPLLDLSNSRYKENKATS